MSSPFPAGVFIICKNEEKNLARALESVKDFAQIVVVDSGSTDGTLEIARRYTDQVLHQEWLGYSGQKAFALSQCSPDWVLNIDADEEVTPQLREDLRQVMAQGRAVAAVVPIGEVFLGKPVPSGVKCVAKVRFFRRDAGRYGKELAHEQIIVDGPVAQVKGCIRHHGETSIAVKVEKNNAYSTLKAREKLAKGKRPSLPRLVLAMPFAFAKDYFLRRNFLNGWRGLVASTINGFYAFMKEAKVWEGASK
jgi:glycosyltransferase involved in cell wall biosynthesis